MGGIRLQGRTSNPSPIVPQRGSGDIQAISGLSNTFNSLGRNTSASSVFDEDQMEVLRITQEKLALMLPSILRPLIG